MVIFSSCGQDMRPDGKNRISNERFFYIVLHDFNIGFVEHLVNDFVYHQTCQK